jgi:hypothetical protein
MSFDALYIFTDRNNFTTCTIADPARGAEEIHRLGLLAPITVVYWRLRGSHINFMWERVRTFTVDESGTWH